MRSLRCAPIGREPPDAYALLCGERDRLNLALSRSLAELLPNASFETIPRAGHIANLDNPEGFNHAVMAFLG